MVDINELMIDNILLFEDGSIGIVKGIMQHQNVVIIELSDNTIYTVGPDKLYPVSIAESLLNGRIKAISFGENMYSIPLNFRGLFLTVDIGSNIEWTISSRDGGFVMPTMEHVHQIQNFYFNMSQGKKLILE